MVSEVDYRKRIVAIAAAMLLFAVIRPLAGAWPCEEGKLRSSSSAGSIVGEV